MKTTNSSTFKLLLICLIFAVVVGGPHLAAAQLKRVAVVPFKINAAEDMSFLRDGIVDMLISRLSWEDKVVVLNRQETAKVLETAQSPLNENKARKIGAELGVDFVLFGSLTIFGNSDSISTDAKFIDVHKQKPIVVFNQAGQSHSDVIAHINLFAQQINETVFGRKTVSHQPPRPAPQKEIGDNTRRHPETLWASEDRTGVYPSYVPTAEGKGSVAVWESRKFKTTINGLAIGDVTGNGSNETVFISDKTVHIFRYSNGRFVKVAELKGQGDRPYIGVDVADINHNGKSEIFVTQFIQSTNILNSFVLEWSGTEFIKIQDNAKWFYRVINLPARGGKMLLGQKKGLGDIFSKTGVYELEWINGQYEPVQRQSLPKNTNIYGFTYGDVSNNGREVIVAFSKDDYLRVYDYDGSRDWESSEHYGGSALYIDTPSPDDPGSRTEDKRVYMKQRIHIADLDKDGKNEIIVVNNQEFSDRLFARLRTFKSGYIEGLAWNKLGFYPKWRTRKISGYISDYTIGDLNNDGRDELVFSTVAKTDLLSVKSRSYIATWSIQTPRP